MIHCSTGKDFFYKEYWAGVHLLQNTCSLELKKQLLFHSFQESTASKGLLELSVY